MSSSILETFYTLALVKSNHLPVKNEGQISKELLTINLNVLLMRYVRKITPEQVKHLREVSRHSRNYRERERAKAILLSFKGYNVTTLSDIFEVSRATITNWLDAWEERGIHALKDLPKQSHNVPLVEVNNNGLGAKELVYQ
ncbi:helix-turn-helix domain-containing protein [Emticicia sp. TH156]|uniref:helix-turn-helix domain-containing protein n=1 Tax=Emticicia sp. TH156 TaxID=2067454 RepID=UPI00117D9888|nr:helix-turn-helix domain-containing protein [Emticicia sp. TH156]